MYFSILLNVFLQIESERKKCIFLSTSSDTFKIWYFPKLLNVFLQIEKMYFLVDLIWRSSPAIRRDFEIKPKLGDSAAKSANLPNGAKSSSRFGPHNLQVQNKYYCKCEWNTIRNTDRNTRPDLVRTISVNNFR